jgi:hypothetical protein
MSASPLCSVIVPSYQSQDTIRACLVSLTAQRDAPPFEIILADSSTDATRQIAAAEFPQVRVLALPERCDPAEARNQGARLGRGRALAFLDSDCTRPTRLAGPAVRPAPGRQSRRRRQHRQRQPGEPGELGRLLLRVPRVPARWPTASGRRT